MVSDDTFRDASETSHECLMIFFIRIRTKVGFTIAGAIVVIQYFISFIKGEEVTAKREKVLCNSDHYFLFFSSNDHLPSMGYLYKGKL